MIASKHLFLVRTLVHLGANPNRTSVNPNLEVQVQVQRLAAPNL
jgi:hypothetical protein